MGGPARGGGLLLLPAVKKYHKIANCYAVSGDIRSNVKNGNPWHGT
jgi:hypothetical protein